MHQVADRVFHTPGVYYRPANLKSLTVLMGNTEARTVYRNFDLQNLHINSADPTHALYQRYLSYNNFIPPNESKYFAHTSSCLLAPDEPSRVADKGLFNVFPLSLTADELNRSSSSTLGLVLFCFTTKKLVIFLIFTNKIFFYF